MIHYYRYLFVKMKVLFNYSELHFSQFTSFKIHTLVVGFSQRNLTFWFFSFCFFIWRARFQILIIELQSIWCKHLLLSWLYCWTKPIYLVCIFLSFFSYGFHGHCWGFLGLPFSTDIPQFSRNDCYRGSHGLLASWKTLFQEMGHNHQLFQVKATKYSLVF